MLNNGSISPVKQFLRNKWVRLVLVIDVIVVIAIIGILIFNASKTAIVSFNVAPIDAKIQLNGQGEYSDGSYQVLPGTYEITISHDNLTPKTFTLELKPNHETTLVAFLSDNGNFEFYKLMDNSASYQRLTEIASKSNNITTDHDTSAEQFISDFNQILSITKVLPIKGYVHADPSISASTAGFTIRDGRSKEECERIACLLVNYYGNGYEETVAEKIKEAGYNPADYQIVYERYN